MGSFLMCCRKIKVVRQRDKSGQAGIRENKSCRKRKFSSKKKSEWDRGTTFYLMSMS